MTNERFTEALVSLLNATQRTDADISRARVVPGEPTCLEVIVDGRNRRVEVIYA